MPQQGSEQIDWTQDPVQDIPGSIKTEVSEKDTFNLAKDILEACAVLFLVNHDPLSFWRTPSPTLSDLSN